ncbi:MAG: class I SAM-dependent methyltransferase [Balneolaceae bacterium]
MLHTIGGNRSVINTDPWIEKYIFPNSMIPSVRQVGKAIDDVFILENWSNHRHDYDKTLMAWHQNFKEHWPKLKQNYSNRFYRMWTYYLLASAGSFRAGKNNQWQMVLTHKQHSGKVQVPPVGLQKSYARYS